MEAKPLPPLTPEAIARFWAAVPDGDNECWEWMKGRDLNGYGRMKVGSRTVKTHRVSWALHFGIIPPGMFVLHRCDNPPCCNPQHLFLGSTADNARDASSKGRLAAGDRHWMRQQPERVAGSNSVGARSAHDRSGSANGRAKLTAEQVAIIRTRYAAGGVTQRELAAEFGVTRPMIGYIVRGVNWTAVA